MSQYEAVYKCGYCGKHSPMTDDQLESAVIGLRPKNEFKSFCECGHFSYASGITFKAQVKSGDWKGCYRGTELS